MTKHEPFIDVRKHILPGYLNLLETYFDLMRKQELRISKGLCFTQILEREWEDELVVNIIAGLQRNKAAYILLDFDDYMADRSEHQQDFNNFFQNIWELSDPEFKQEKKAYLERIERIMRRHSEADPERCNQLILTNLPPIAEMSMDMMERFNELLFRRMENNLPLFIFFREDYSEFLREASRVAEIIWALDECTYPAERYLFHPYGLRYITLLNRRNVHPHY